MNSVPLDGQILDGRHVLTVRVYYEDTDFTGIVYHANYLRYMERGRTNYLRLIGADHRALFEETEKEAPGFAFVVRSMNIDFHKPARMDDELEVVTEPEQVKGASTTVRQRILRHDEMQKTFFAADRAVTLGDPRQIRGHAKTHAPTMAAALVGLQRELSADVTGAKLLHIVIAKQPELRRIARRFG